jgi:hypothetical protein
LAQSHAFIEILEVDGRRAPRDIDTTEPGLLQLIIVQKLEELVKENILEWRKLCK